MKEIEKNESSVSKPSELNLSYKDLKALFYLLNAKPDSSVQLLEGQKKIDLGCIRDLNERIQRKLDNHELIGQIASINFQFEKGKILDFKAWEEFINENWNSVNQTTEIITMIWDVSIKLPKYQNPQRHTIKVRVGGALTPKEMMQVMWNLDDIAELKEKLASGIIRIDFIDQVLASELIDLISTWYEGLQKLPKKSGATSFVEKHEGKILKSIKVLFPFLLLIVFHFYFVSFCSWGNDVRNLSLSNIQFLAIVFLGVFLIGKLIGDKLSSGFKSIVDDYDDYPVFSISKGDELAILEHEEKNNNVTKIFMKRLAVSVLATSLVLLFKFILQYFIK